ncbi:MAG: hypothetical protein U5L04_00085 [Trueperaceae bacterium]|nr:hypothetical protein [Trueperaceae bacterium]
MNTPLHPNLSGETVPYGGWPNCYRLTNGVIDLVITLDVGPRVIRAGFVGQANLFYEHPDHVGLQGGAEWRLYGGHRLWCAPEAKPRTYYPDNEPVALEERLEDQTPFVRVTAPVETTTGIQKQLDLTLWPDHNHVRVTHRLYNRGMWPVDLAPWALSVMKPGGVAVVPLPPRGEHPRDLLPSSTLALWPYTDLSDPRWTWGRRHILLRQDAQAPQPQKFGASVSEGWAAYVVDGYAFVKCFRHQPEARYPDLESSVEVFTNQAMLELETLGPLARLDNGATVEHTEDWFLFDNVPTPERDDEVDDTVGRRVGEARALLTP